MDENWLTTWFANALGILSLNWTRVLYNPKWNDDWSLTNLISGWKQRTEANTGTRPASTVCWHKYLLPVDGSAHYRTRDAVERDEARSAGPTSLG
jgi:hypothetical protein